MNTPTDNDPTGNEELSRELTGIQAEIQRLDDYEAQLRAALAEIEHHARRCNDALERAGWRCGEAEAQDSSLADNHRLTTRDLRKIRAQRARLADRLIPLRRRLGPAADAG